jgi:hypothetical protein
MTFAHPSFLVLPAFPTIPSGQDTLTKPFEPFEEEKRRRSSSSNRKTQHIQHQQKKYNKQKKQKKQKTQKYAAIVAPGRVAKWPLTTDC